MGGKTAMHQMNRSILWTSEHIMNTKTRGWRWVQSYRRMGCDGAQGKKNIKIRFGQTGRFIGSIGDRHWAEIHGALCSPKSLTTPLTWKERIDDLDASAATNAVVPFIPHMLPATRNGTRSAIHSTVRQIQRSKGVAQHFESGRSQTQRYEPCQSINSQDR